MCIKHVKIICRVVVQISTMKTSVGVLDPPLGNTRLQVVRLFSALLMCNDATIAKEVIQLQLFSTLLVSKREGEKERVREGEGERG